MKRSDIKIGGANYFHVEYAIGIDFGQIALLSDLRLTLVNGVVGTEGTNAGTTTNPQVNRNALTDANLSNTFYLGSINSLITPLPITLVSFTAMPENDQVKLSWETAAEVNNNYFTILRSRDAVHWQQILEIPGSGNTNSESKYAVIDPEPYSGVSYYQLGQSDMDGKRIVFHGQSRQAGCRGHTKNLPKPYDQHGISQRRRENAGVPVQQFGTANECSCCSRRKFRHFKSTSVAGWYLFSSFMG